MHYTCTPYAYDALEPHFDERTVKFTILASSNLCEQYQYCVKLPELAGLKLMNSLRIYIKYLLINVPLYVTMRDSHSNHTFFWKGLKLGTQLHGSLKKMPLNVILVVLMHLRVV